MTGRDLQTKKIRNKKDFIIRHALVLKTVNCGNVITIIAIIVQQIQDVILLYLCFSIPSKIRVADMLAEETQRN
jgi:hypothetical protein